MNRSPLLAVALSAAVGYSGTALADAQQIGDRLIIVLDDSLGDQRDPNTFNHSADIMVRDGTATVIGVPRVPDFTVYSGIRSLEIDAGSGLDSINLMVETDRNIDIDITGGGETEAKVGVAARPGDMEFVTNISANFRAAEDKLELDLSSMRDATINLNVNGLAGSNLVGVKAEYGPGIAITNNFNLSFGRGEDQVKVEIKSESDILTNNFTVFSNEGEDLIGIGVEHLGLMESRNMLTLVTAGSEDSVEVGISAPFANADVSGTIDLGQSQNSAGLKIESLTASTGGLTIAAGNAQDGLDVSIKGEFDTTGGDLVLSGGGSDDTLSVKAEGGVTRAGSVILIGGPGAFDKCEGFPGAVFDPSCEDISQ